ncbi:MAG TPA: dTDP-4-dehydrorhamnose reductase [Jatrophihabitans sp.]|nr:dTDP-4-dehydrorhamnose reductase [Jatrophihabitans sp.]
MRWLVTGANGQLGQDLTRVLAADADAEVRALGSAELDITSSAAISRIFAEFQPDVVLNAAAYTAVDAAETDEQRAYAVNAGGPALLATHAARTGARLVQPSTDYVFDGTATSPYPVDAPTGPRSAYGRTKLAGEQAVRELAPEHGFVVRTSWVYGAHGKNFVKTMSRLEASRDTITVVGDQTGAPTWSFDLAGRLVDLARSDVAAGIYHCTGAGSTTWHGFAQAIFAELGADPERVQPISTAEYPVPAPRPAYSVLSNSEWLAAGLPPMMEWRDALRAAFAADRSAYLAS